MRRAIRDWFLSILRLIRFVFWYGVAVLGMFYLLPRVGAFLEGQYDSLSSTVKFAAVLGFFLVATIWHVVEVRKRWSQSWRTSDRMETQ